MECAYVDHAHIEQKNGSIVRRWIGYDRCEGERVTRLMNDFYALLRLYNNFFQPSVKLIPEKSVHMPTPTGNRLRQMRTRERLRSGRRWR